MRSVSQKLTKSANASASGFVDVRSMSAVSVSVSIAPRRACKAPEEIGSTNREERLDEIIAVRDEFQAVFGGLVWKSCVWR